MIRKIKRKLKNHLQKFYCENFVIQIDRNRYFTMKSHDAENNDNAKVSSHSHSISLQKLYDRIKHFGFIGPFPILASDISFVHIFNLKDRRLEEIYRHTMFSS